MLRAARDPRDNRCCRQGRAASPQRSGAPRAAPRLGQLRRNVRSAGPRRRCHAALARRQAGGTASHSSPARLSVRRVAGQAVRHTGRLLHLLAELAIGVAVRVGVLIGALSWRLAQGPLELPWLARRLEAAANAGGGPTRLSIGTMALAWEGFRLGTDRPIDFRLTDIAVSDANGRQRVDIPEAEVTLSLRAAMLGHVVPRLVLLDGPKLTFVRARDGAIALDLGSLTEAMEPDSNAPAATPLGVLYAELARPPSGDFAGASGLLSQIRRVRIRNAQVAIVDRQLGISVRSPNAQIEVN